MSKVGEQFLDRFSRGAILLFYKAPRRNRPEIPKSHHSRLIKININFSLYISVYTIFEFLFKNDFFPCCARKILFVQWFFAVFYVIKKGGKREKFEKTKINFCWWLLVLMCWAVCFEMLKNRVSRTLEKEAQKHTHPNWKAKRDPELGGGATVTETTPPNTLRRTNTH